MSNTMPIPRYINSLDKKTYIPANLRKLLNPNRDDPLPVPEGYELCLVGERESVKKDLSDKNYTGKPFIHLDAAAITVGDFKDISETMKRAIININQMVSLPNSTFNTDPKLGIHTLGFVSTDDVQALNELGYGLLTWHGVGVYKWTIADL